MKYTRQYNTITVSWQTHYDNLEPRCESDVIKERIKELRWDLGIDNNETYSLEELEEMNKETISEARE